MRQVRRRAIVPHSAEQMFDLVNDIESYPDFLPWCRSAEVLESSEQRVRAQLELERNGLRRTFTTDNTLDRPTRLKMDLVDGPFRHLDGGWKFRDLPASNGSEVALEIEFEFTNFFVEMAFGRFFEQTCGSLVGAFVARGRELYGRT